VQNVGTAGGFWVIGESESATVKEPKLGSLPKACFNPLVASALISIRVNQTQRVNCNANIIQKIVS